MKLEKLTTLVAVAVPLSQVQAFRGDTYANAYERCSNTQGLANPYERCYEGFCCGKDIELTGNNMISERYCLPQTTSSSTSKATFTDT